MGHRESPLDGISLENVKLFVATDPSAAFDYADHALDIRWAKNLKIKGMDVSWENPPFKAWQSALYLQDIRGLELNAFAGRGAPDRDVPAVVFNQVVKATIRNTHALEGTPVFLKVMGRESREIRIQAMTSAKPGSPTRLMQKYHPAPSQSGGTSPQGPAP